MAYTKQTWVDDESVLSAARLNHMEEGIENNTKGPIIQDITVDNGVVAGDFIYNDHGTWKIDDTSPNEQGTHIYDGTNARTMGLMDHDDFSAYLNKSLYIQTDGKLGLTVTTQVAARVESATQIEINFSPPNTNPQAYAGEMVQFFAIPGTTGKVRIKTEMPENADGFELYRGTSAYDDEGRGSWGTLVDTITDDSSYLGDNEWYEDDDDGNELTDGTTYYYKAFPYAGSVYNNTKGVNETQTEAGLLFAEYTFDEVTGSTVTDTASGTYNGTISNAIVDDGEIGYSIIGTGSGMVVLSDTVNLNDKTLFFHFKSSNQNCGICDRYTNIENLCCWISSTNYLYFGGKDSSTTSPALESDHVGNVGSEAWVEIRFQSSNKRFYVYINNTYVGYSDSFNKDYFLMEVIGKANRYTSTAYWMNGEIDQMRVFDGTLTTATRTNLYNDGEGC